jgi:hypothetical protein
MSVFANTEAIPSRVLALLRLLAALPGHAATADDLHDLWWPRAERPADPSVDYFQRVVLELREADLIEEVEEEGGVKAYSLSSTVSEAWRSPDAIVEHGPHLLTQRLFVESPDRRNDDLGYALAWWLALPFDALPPDYKDLTAVWVSRVDPEAIPWRTPSEGEPLRVNESRLRQMVLWAAYLGLGWEHGTSAQATSFLQPDPTLFLRRRLAQVLPKDGALLRINDAWNQVTEGAPFLDQGRYVRDLEDHGVIDPKPERSFSDAVSMALLRLEREGSVRLTTPKDAGASEQRLIRWDGTSRPVTYIARLSEAD